MKNLKDTKTKIYPSTTREGKELPSNSALDSPSVLSKLAKPTPAIDSDMSHVIDDATSTMNDATALLHNTVPLGELLYEHLIRVRIIDYAEEVIFLKLMKSLKLNTLRHLLDLALLDMNCLIYLRVMLWMER